MEFKKILNEYLPLFIVLLAVTLIYLVADNIIEYVLATCIYLLGMFRGKNTIGDKKWI